MTELTVEAGVCGLVTTIRTDPGDGGSAVAIEAAAGLALPRDVSMGFFPPG